ncbi:hypothetical protein VTJ83DRAFT_4852 [Remersonia thermophila]|uniref:Uncharacterized protein n=1 Tax=Remersonia thermophila TaxID=72144 RepID=A0ABR4DB53_9PEZI
MSAPTTSIRPCWWLASRAQLPQASTRPSFGRTVPAAHVSSTTRRLAGKKRSKPSSPSSSGEAPKLMGATLYDQLFGGIPTTSSSTPPKHARDDEGGGLDDGLDGEAIPDWDKEFMKAMKEVRKPLGPDVLPGDELKPYLDEDVQKDHEPQETAAQKSERDALKVMVMHHMPRSLIESDFYRYASQGRHVAGWAGGIVKVVQSISPVTREPRGQYFVFFDAEDPAKAYKENLGRLPRLDEEEAAAAKRTQNKASKPGPSSSSGTENGDTNDANAGEAGSAAASDPPTFPTLAYTTSPTLLSTSHLISLITQHLPLPPSSSPSAASPSPSSLIPRPLLAGTTNSLPHGVLEYAKEGGAALPKGSPVLLRLTGSKLTVDTMLRAIQEDGRERNLPWRLIEDRPDDAAWPRPVQTVRAGSGRIGFGELGEPASEAGKGREGDRSGEAVQYGYTRFIVTLADMGEARRFARVWNQKEMLDERTERMVRVNAAVIW